MGQTTLRQTARPVPYSRSLRLRHYAPLLLLLMLVAGSISGFLAAHAYINIAFPKLHAVTAYPRGSYLDLAEQWWTGDAMHLEELQAEWPASIPTLLGEIVLLWFEKEAILTEETLQTATGVQIVPADAGGRLHLLDVAIDSRLAALGNRWNRDEGEDRFLLYYDYPIDTERRVQIVQPEEVAAILDAVAVPASVFADYRVVLLPFALEKTAGLGSAGEAILGAAPATGYVSPHRTAYTLLHELGHHVHFTYMDAAANGDALWKDYMSLRGIEHWTESGRVNSQAWALSPHETFAEDFRILFGDESARHFVHGTTYGDPREASDRGEAVRSFILGLLPG